MKNYRSVYARLATVRVACSPQRVRMVDHILSHYEYDDECGGRMSDTVQKKFHEGKMKCSSLVRMKIMAHNLTHITYVLYVSEMCSLFLRPHSHSLHFPVI